MQGWRSPSYSGFLMHSGSCCVLLLVACCCPCHFACCGLACLQGTTWQGHTLTLDICVHWYLNTMFWLHNLRKIESKWDMRVSHCDKPGLRRGFACLGESLAVVQDNTEGNATWLDVSSDKQVYLAHCWVVYGHATQWATFEAEVGDLIFDFGADLVEIDPWWEGLWEGKTCHKAKRERRVELCSDLVASCLKLLISKVGVREEKRQLLLNVRFIVWAFSLFLVSVLLASLSRTA